jgi:hypothetical protein
MPSSRMWPVESVRPDGEDHVSLFRWTGGRHGNFHPTTDRLRRRPPKDRRRAGTDRTVSRCRGGHTTVGWARTSAGSSGSPEVVSAHRASGWPPGSAYGGAEAPGPRAYPVEIRPPEPHRVPRRDHRHSLRVEDEPGRAVADLLAPPAPREQARPDAEQESGSGQIGGRGRRRGSV